MLLNLMTMILAETANECIANIHLRSIREGLDLVDMNPGWAYEAITKVKKSTLQWHGGNSGTKNRAPSHLERRRLNRLDQKKHQIVLSR